MQVAQVCDVIGLQYLAWQLLGKSVHSAFGLRFSMSRFHLGMSMRNASAFTFFLPDLRCTVGIRELYAIPDEMVQT